MSLQAHKIDEFIVLDELKKAKPKFNIIRQIIADSNVDDFEEIFRFLYENVDEYLPGKAGTAAFLINEHQYKANFRIDKEINVMSLINNLINNKFHGTTKPTTPTGSLTIKAAASKKF